MIEGLRELQGEHYKRERDIMKIIIFIGQAGIVLIAAGLLITLIYLIASGFYFLVQRLFNW